MRYLKEFYFYNKKFFITSLVILILVIVFLIYFFNQSEPNTNSNFSEVKKYDLVLLGSQEIIVYQDEKYQEIGYYAVLNNEIVTEQVEVISFLDTSTLGTYEITYTIGDIKKTRVVKIIQNPNDSIENIKLSLIGDSKSIVMVGEEYEELGCLAYDKDNNDISNRVTIEGEVDTSKPGTYYITYKILENGEVKILTREVVVREELSIKLNYPTSYTNQDIKVDISVLGGDFSYLKLPDGTVSKNKNITYTISKNGIYYFYAFDTNGNYKIATAQITNIDKIVPSATCTAKSYRSKTEIEVKANDETGIDHYVYNSNYVSASSKYTIPSKLENVKVLVYDKAGNVNNITCQVSESYIEMHFIAGVSDDDAILIRTTDKTIMIDGGRYEARDKIISYLKNLGVTKIDALIGSHVHWNHVQSHAAIIDNFEVGDTYYSVDILNCVSKKHCKSDDVKYIKDKLEEKNITPTILSTKSYLEIGEMKLYFIGPIRGKLTTYQNANSLVFILQYGNNKFMFTGDTPDNYMDTTKFQTQAGYFNMNLDIDVLKWPHHGYEDLTDAFFKATTPKYAIIPNCCHCSSTYPSTTNKNLMKKYGTTYYQVCDSKNIVLISDGEEITIKTNQDPIDYKR